MERLITICAVVILAVAAAPAVADITIGPEDGAYYTYQMWSFDTTETQLGLDWGPLFPEVDNNPYGDPLAMGLSTFGGGTAGWYAKFEGRFGVMHSGPGSYVDAVLYIPNFPDENMYKIVQIETSYQGSCTISEVEGGTEVNKITYTTEDGWTDMTSTWIIDQQPESEMIFITWAGTGDAFANVDFIEVATVCVPVPGAVLLGMLGLGAVGIKLRKFA